MKFEDLSKKEVKEQLEEEIGRINDLLTKMSEKNVIGSWLRSDISYLLKNTIYSYKEIIKKFL